MVAELEQRIDRYMAEVELPPQFVIPGGNKLSAQLDVARTVIRRAERRIAALAEEGELASETVIHFVNRASDAVYAMARYAEIRALDDEVADLEERLASRKAVDQAKGLLQEGLGLTEAEAFRWIQKTAMDLRKSMREVAEGVIDHSKAGTGPKATKKKKAKPDEV